MWGAKVKIKRLQKDPSARDKVRGVLLPQITTLLEENNTVFDEARLELKQASYAQGEQPYADFVLILDNLEKIERIDGRKEGEESQRELFIERRRSSRDSKRTLSTLCRFASCARMGRN